MSTWGRINRRTSILTGNSAARYSCQNGRSKTTRCGRDPPAAAVVRNVPGEAVTTHVYSRGRIFRSVLGRHEAILPKMFG